MLGCHTLGSLALTISPVPVFLLSPPWNSSSPVLGEGAHRSFRRLGWVGGTLGQSVLTSLPLWICLSYPCGFCSGKE